jgi:hypothetical protein
MRGLARTVTAQSTSAGSALDGGCRSYQYGQLLAKANVSGTKDHACYVGHAYEGAYQDLCKTGCHLIYITMQIVSQRGKQSGHSSS